MKLGNALTALGMREDEITHIEMAVAAYREASKEYTRDRAPMDWAVVQGNLANALVLLGAREKNLERFDAAVTAYGEALEILTPTAAPSQNEAIRKSLARAHAAILQWLKE
jgi:tetratricopeptide (TPR) repeat protein